MYESCKHSKGVEALFDGGGRDAVMKDEGAGSAERGRPALKDVGYRMS